MIKEYTISNFKAFSDPATLPIKPITLIYGQNSAGKSSVLQSLLMLKQSTALERQPSISGKETSVSNIIVNGKYTNLSSYKNLIHNNIDDSKFLVRFAIHPDRFSDYAKNIKSPKITQDFINELNQILEYLAVEFIFGFQKNKGEEIVFIDSIKLYIGDKNEEFVHYYLSSIPGNAKSHFSVDNVNESSKFAKFYWENYGKHYVIKHLSTEQRCSIFMFGDEKIKFFPKLHDYPDSNIGKIVSKDVDIDNYNQLKSIWDHYIFSLTDIYGENESLFDFDNVDFCHMYDFEFPDEVCKTNLKSILNGLDLESYVFGDHYFENRNSFWYADHISVVTMMLQKCIIYCLNNIVYVGPYRKIIDRKNFAINIGEQNIYKCHDIYGLFSKNELILHEVNKYLSKLKIKYSLVLDNFFSLDAERQFSVSLVGRGTAIKTKISDVGYGVSQVLPVIIESLTSFNKSILIEQPELHLHPALQSELGDLFIDSAVNKNNTLLIETHSEHILLRIMRRIRETTNGTLPEGATPIKAEDVSVVYVESIETDDDRHSIIREMPLNDQGELVKAWPGGFFEEGLREVF